MQLILNSFQQLFDFIATLGQFLLNLLDSLISFLKMIPACVEMLMETITYLPSQVMAFAAISITVSVIFIIVGRSRTN